MRRGRFHLSSGRKRWLHRYSAGRPATCVLLPQFQSVNSIWFSRTGRGGQVAHDGVPVMKRMSHPNPWKDEALSHHDLLPLGLPFHHLLAESDEQEVARLIGLSRSARRQAGLSFPRGRRSHEGHEKGNENITGTTVDGRSPLFSSSSLELGRR